MLPSSEPSPPVQRPRPRRRRSAWSLRLTPGGLVILLFLNLLTLGLITYFLFQVQVSGIVQAWLASRPTTNPTPTKTFTPSPTVSSTPTKAAPSATLSQAAPLPTSTPFVAVQKGLIILSMTEGINSHLFAYQPQLKPNSAVLHLTRLTDGPWDDFSPAVSPDGKRVAFVSNRNGYWDIYSLEFASGRVLRLTDSLEYDGSPAWSPDGVWIVYESYIEENLEIFILNVESQQPPIRLTSHPDADYSPAWAPQGRQIAFVSNRSGGADIWLADLDQADEDLFINLSHTSNAQEAHPAWSRDGTVLAWSVVADGVHELLAKDLSQPELPLRRLGSGDWLTWSPDGETVLAGLFTPYRHYLTAYPAQIPGLVMPLVELPGFLNGLDWEDSALPNPLHEIYRQAANITPTPLWLPALTPIQDAPEGRSQVVPLQEVQAPQPFLHDMVDESFQALRQVVASEAGWDLLASLENAFVPLTTPLDPGMGQDWLYTGRAFAVNTAPLNAGWLSVVREDYGAQTYWRVYLRTRYQDGSAGMPLQNQPWDFTTRYGSNTAAYELGGSVNPVIPPGYWLDFTRLAAGYGWQRQPASSFWRASYPAARFNVFAFMAGLDWQDAMAELYPPEALLTPTQIIPPTRTLTPTPRWYQSPTPTLTLTPRPTLTPLPETDTPAPTQTNSPSSTPSATLAPSRTTTATASPTPTR